MKVSALEHDSDDAIHFIGSILNKIVKLGAQVIWVDGNYNAELVKSSTNLVNVGGTLFFEQLAKTVDGDDATGGELLNTPLPMHFASMCVAFRFTHIDATRTAQLIAKLDSLIKYVLRHFTKLQNNTSLLFSN